MTDASASKRVVLVAAYGDNRALGNAGAMPWHLPEDFAHFKATTLGHTLVMGRVTYDAIGRPLPGRTTIVVTRDPDWSAEGSLVAHSFEEALEIAAGLPGDVMVAGGAQIYAVAMPYATHQVLTEVRLSPAADTFYPEFDEAQWQETARIDRDGLSWVWYERKKQQLY
jgi:dihydrofolate reductase